MSRRNFLDPARREQKIDPRVKALVDRGLKEGMRSTKLYAVEGSKDPFWPIGFCVAWVLGRDSSKAARLYARHRLGIGVVHVKGWIDARTSLLRALATGKVEALGVREADGRRVSIPALEWIDLRINREELTTKSDERTIYLRTATLRLRPHRCAIHGRSLRRSEAPEKPKIKGGELRAHALTVNGQSDKQQDEHSEFAGRNGSDGEGARKARSTAGEPPAETPAMKRAREKKEREQACLTTLVERMRADPNDPVPKVKLRKNFPGISSRAFGALFSQATREPGCAAWSKAGRRRRKMT